jgi:hypothetical protein
MTLYALYGSIKKEFFKLAASGCIVTNLLDLVRMKKKNEIGNYYL